MAAHSILGAGLVVTLLVGGCNGSGEGPPPAPPTSTTTTVAPTTTIDPISAETAAVSEAAKQARLARLNALVSPTDVATIAALDQYYVPDSPARGEVDQSLADLESEGWAVRPHPTVPETVTVERVTFDGSTPPTAATLVVCIIDSGVVYEPNATADGQEAIVNDVVYAYRSEYDMSKANGMWKLADVRGIAEWQGVAECPSPS